MTFVIRSPDIEETPLSSEEKRIAMREDIRPATWHPALVRNWSVMSARMHRADAIRHLNEEQAA